MNRHSVERTDTRVGRRVEQLGQAAAVLMARRGYHGTSMHDVAADAGVSVGLIYRYFDNKEALLAHIVVDIMGGYLERLPPAMAGLDDPIEQLRAGFTAYCKVIDEHRSGAVLAYREAKAMAPTVLERVKEFELATTELLAEPRDAVALGLFRPVDPFLVAYDLSFFGHMWALKHWYFADRISIDDYISQQFSVCIGGVIRSAHAARYAALVEPTTVGSHA